ncbi:hypothetical protein K7G95_00275 (plasmid) [Escherichia coli]|nr:hypothetical protein K7G95_00275 [Escherichia coli]
MAVYAPATGTHTGVWHPAGNEQGPAATTESACAKRRCPTSRRPLPGCRERRPRRDRGGATGTVAASQGFHASDRSGSPKPRQRVRRRLAGAPAAACRSRA